jgi:hypothetical protein
MQGRAGRRQGGGIAGILHRSKSSDAFGAVASRPRSWGILAAKRRLQPSWQHCSTGAKRTKVRGFDVSGKHLELPRNYTEVLPDMPCVRYDQKEQENMPAG